MSRVRALIFASALCTGATAFQALVPRASLHHRSLPAVRVAQPAHFRQSRVTLSDAAATAPGGQPGKEADKEAVVLVESTQRSIAKAVSWRLTAAVITLCTSLFFSGSMMAAAGIVGMDFLTKSLTMFIGERLWNKSNVGRSDKGDSIGRSILKAVVWRLFAATNTLISAGIFTGGWEVAAQIAGSDALIKTSLFVVFERVWAMISWGRYPAPKP